MGKVKQRKKASSRVGENGNNTSPIKPNTPANEHHNGASHHNTPQQYYYHNPSIISLLFYTIKVLLISILSIPFCFLTLLLSPIYGYPPKVVQPTQTIRFIQYTLNSHHITPNARIELLLTILCHSISSHISGVCWLLDEILYGKQLNTISIHKPTFILSGYRSASTQMARTITQDKQHFIAPNAIMCAFPYLWVWKLVTYMVGDDSGLTTSEINGYLNKNFSKESTERHDNDHFAVDTFDGYFLSSHLNGLAFKLGPDVIVKEMNSATFEEYNRTLFEYNFVEHVDRLARKTLLFNGITSPLQQQDVSFLLKGHFLQSANALQSKYSNARFLTVLRDPLERLQSGINHMAVNATLWQGKEPHWDWLADAYQQIEIKYCHEEMKWYNNCTSNEQMQRLAVKFDSFIKDFDKTMKCIYKDLLDVSNNEDIPKLTPPQSSKVSKRYTINRSLKGLGIDEAELKVQLTDYYAWMKKQ